jgi:hypothetical protein
MIMDRMTHSVNNNGTIDCRAFVFQLVEEPTGFKFPLHSCTETRMKKWIAEKSKVHASRSLHAIVSIDNV